MCQRYILRFTCWPYRCLHQHMMLRQSSRMPLGLKKRSQITQCFTAERLLTRLLTAPVSCSNPQLLPTRNLTVRNLSARRLKPEECYCSGHSCTSTGLATAATECVGRVGGWGGWGGWGGRRAGGIEGVKKATFTRFVAPCGFVTKQRILDSELTHSSALEVCRAFFSSPFYFSMYSWCIFLQHNRFHFIYISLCSFSIKRKTAHAQNSLGCWDINADM